MCGGIVLGVIGGVIAAKLLVHWRMHRYAGGGGCGYRGGHCGHKGWGRHGGWGRWGRWHGRRGDDAGTGAGGGGPTIELSQVMQGLELNRRQGQEVGEVFARLQSTIGDDRGKVAEVLAAIAAGSFDHERAVRAFGTRMDPELSRELCDDAEHVHNILTLEQRERLQATIARV